MSLRPDTSRCQLTAKQFSPSEGGWFLRLPRYYADLFQSYFPFLLKQTRDGFRSTDCGTMKCAVFPALPPREVERIEGFLSFFERVVCLGLNRHLRGEFSDEVDFVLALDFTRPSPHADRTEIGELEYHAKYEQNSDAISELQRELVLAATSLPPGAIARPRLLTHVPSAQGQTFCLPARLTRGIVDMVPRTFWDDPAALVAPTLTVMKPAAKRLGMSEKLAYWKMIVEVNGIRLSRSVEGYSVIVVDDLYQSGASLWSFAKYLKRQQARSVVGLACVKSLRDTDNQPMHTWRNSSC